MWSAAGKLAAFAFRRKGIQSKNLRRYPLLAAADPKNLALVDANWMEGKTKYNVNSTPTFIINGISRAGEIPYDELQKILHPLVKK